MGKHLAIVANEGCVSCHSMVHVDSSMGNSGFTMMYPPLHRLASSKNPFIRKAGDFIPSVTPIYTASSYIYDSMEDLDKVFALEKQGPSYARYDNPTRVALEELLRELESGH